MTSEVYPKRETAKILVVDDDDNLRQTVTELLELEDYDVYQASSGEEALELAGRNFFNVILMDYNLGALSGLEAVNRIRTFNSQTQIIMITAHASLDAALKAIQESVYDFLIKPVDFSYLKRTIKRALEKFELERGNRELLEKLKAANADLSALNDMKTKFFSIVSHDLSNSMMALSMSNEMLQRAVDNPSEDQKKKMRYMNDSINQVLLLVTDLVDWAAIEKGKLRVEKKDFDLAASLRGAIEVFKEKAKLKEIEMTFEDGGEPARVFGDEKRLRQVIFNIIENALRHTPRAGSVRVWLMKKDGKNAIVSVKDSGDGIEPDFMKELFKSFSQQGRGGRLGLGMSISRDIVSNHGGEIWAHSDGAGKGAVFSFTIPLIPQAK